MPKKEKKAVKALKSADGGDTRNSAGRKTLSNEKTKEPTGLGPAFSWKVFKLSTRSMSVATLLWQRGIIIALCA
jgi:hypothetical protein